MRAFLLAIVLCTAVPAQADIAAEARLHDELAREHFARGRYADALREFFFEQRLAPNPRILFNIAICFDELRRSDDAFLFFQAYLDGTDQDAERRRVATEAVARLGPRVARVRVTSDPPGADVFVDQRDHGSYGQTPRLIALPPGRHRLIFEREGHRSVEVEVEAVRGQEIAASGTLERILGQVALTLPASAHVTARNAAGETVAEGDAAAGERFEVALPPGPYELEIAAEGHRAHTALVRVEAGATSEPSIALEALPPPTGDLTVTANASGAIIALDGERVGFAPTVLTSLATGRHRVRVEHPGLMAWEDEIEIAPDVRNWLTISLVVPPEVTRSPVVWALGGIGVATLGAGIVAGGFAIDNWSRSTDPMVENYESLASTGETLNIVTDVLLITGVVALAAAVVLYFVTESREERASTGTVSRGER